MENIEIAEDKLNAIVGYVPFEMLSPSLESAIILQKKLGILFFLKSPGRL